MSIRLFVGATIIVLSFISIAICYLAARNPRQPKWATDTVVGSFITPLATGGIFGGAMAMGEALFVNFDLLTTLDLVIAMGILAAGVLFIFMMRIGKRVEEYEAMGNSPEVKNSGTGVQPKGPVSGASATV